MTGPRSAPSPCFLVCITKLWGTPTLRGPHVPNLKTWATQHKAGSVLVSQEERPHFQEGSAECSKGCFPFCRDTLSFELHPGGGVPFWMFWEAKKKITTWYFQNFPIASDYCKWPIHLNPCLLLEGVTLWSLTLGSAVSRFLWPCGIVWKHLDTSGLNQRDGREKKRKWQDTGHHQITSASEASKGLKLLKICWTMLNSCNEVRQETGDPAGLCCSGGPWWHLESRVFWVRSFALLTCITVFYHIVSLAASLQWGQAWGLRL